MVVPTVHLNGTAGAVLRDQFTAALEATRKAIDAICDAGPNARDFYAQGVDAPFVAKREHEARLAALRRVRDLATILEGILGQLDARDAARRSR